MVHLSRLSILVHRSQRSLMFRFSWFRSNWSHISWCQRWFALFFLLFFWFVFHSQFIHIIVLQLSCTYFHRRSINSLTHPLFLCFHCLSKFHITHSLSFTITYLLIIALNTLLISRYISSSMIGYLILMKNFLNLRKSTFMVPFDNFLKSYSQL